MKEKFLQKQLRKTFEDIVQISSSYVDKTAYLANMIEGDPKKPCSLHALKNSANL